MRQALKPVGIAAEALADDISADRFRLRRARRMEHALFAKIERENDRVVDASTAKAEVFIHSAKGLQPIAPYANRLSRPIEKAWRRLEVLQAERKAAEAKAREEAILLAQHAESKGETYAPGRDFLLASEHGWFVDSRDDVRAAIDRSRRLEEAKTCLADANAGLPACASQSQSESQRFAYQFVIEPSGR